MPIYRLDGLVPQIPESGSHFIAPSAQVIGDVRMAEKSSIWFNAVVRADNEPIVLGDGSNIQDGCVCHVDPGFPMTIGADVSCSPRNSPSAMTCTPSAV